MDLLSGVMISWPGADRGPMRSTDPTEPFRFAVARSVGGTGAQGEAVVTGVLQRMVVVNGRL